MSEIPPDAYLEGYTNVDKYSKKGFSRCVELVLRYPAGDGETVPRSSGETLFCKVSEESRGTDFDTDAEVTRGKTVLALLGEGDPKNCAYREKVGDAIGCGASLEEDVLCPVAKIKKQIRLEQGL